MAKKIIKRFIPDPEWIKKQHSMKLLGDWIHDPNIWHLNRNSASTAVFIGLFLAFIPVPTQMVFAALLAIAFRANLAIAVILVWITNPFTMAPIFFLSYKVGTAVLGTPQGDFHVELSLEWFTQGIAQYWQPFLLGSVLCGLFFGLLGSATVRWTWRRHTIKRWHDRQRQRKHQ